MPQQAIVPSALKKRAFGAHCPFSSVSSGFAAY